MGIVAGLIFTVLTITALIHTAWAFGVTWPAKDRQTLVDAVLGAEGARNMPSPALTLAVAAGMLAAGGIALWGADVVDFPLPEWMRTLGLAVVALIFLLRGVVSYLPIALPEVQPFYRLNRLYYSPLILMISVGYLVLLVAHLSSV